MPKNVNKLRYIKLRQIYTKEKNILYIIRFFLQRSTYQVFIKRPKCLIKITQYMITLTTFEVKHVHVKNVQKPIKKIL